MHQPRSCKVSSHIELMKFLVSTFLCNISSINLFTCRCWYILLFGPITVDINLIWVIELIKQYKYVLIKTSILEKEQSLSRTEQFYERSCVCFQVFSCFIFFLHVPWELASRGCVFKFNRTVLWFYICILEIVLLNTNLLEQRAIKKALGL